MRAARATTPLASFLSAARSTVDTRMSPFALRRCCTRCGPHDKDARLILGQREARTARGRLARLRFVSPEKSTGNTCWDALLHSQPASLPQKWPQIEQAAWPFESKWNSSRAFSSTLSDSRADFLCLSLVLSRLVLRRAA